MRIADILRGLLPPAAYDPTAPGLGAVVEAEANAIQAAVDGADRIEAAISPATADQDISEWERLLDITPLPDATPASRAAAVLVKLGELGGLSRAYFTRLAASAGYGVTITEPRAFRAGVSRCGERLYGEDIVFFWQVRIDSRPVGATPGMDAALEATFNDLKPAHTLCEFIEE